MSQKLQSEQLNQKGSMAWLPFCLRLVVKLGSSWYGNNYQEVSVSDSTFGSMGWWWKEAPHHHSENTPEFSELTLKIY